MRAWPRVAALLGSALLGPGAAAGPGPAAAAFERPPVGPGPAALGGVLAVAADPVFGNPAGLAPGPARWSEFWASRPFGLSGLVEVQAAAALAAARGGAGLGVRRFGSAEYAEKELRLALGWAPGLSDDRAPVVLGVAARGLSVEGTGFSARRGVALDAAIRARPESGTEIGAVLESVLGAVPGDPAGRARRASLGVSRSLPGGLAICLEVQRREDRPLAGVVGLAWEPVSVLEMRAGIREDPAALAWGFALRGPGVAVRGSATHVDPLGTTVRVGVVFTHGERRSGGPFR